MLKEVAETSRTARPLFKIRTGVKVEGRNSKLHPEETAFFFLNPVEEVLDNRGNPMHDKDGKPMFRTNPNVLRLIDALGTDKPMELEIVFPTDNLDAIIETYRAWWGANKLVCKGDGQYAIYNGDQVVSGLKDQEIIDGVTYLEGDGYNRICDPTTCPQAQAQGKYGPMCKPHMDIRFLMPKYFDFGYIQITTTSHRASKDIFSLLRALKHSPVWKKKYGLDHSFIGVPMTLSRKSVTNGKNGYNQILQLTVNQTRLEEEVEKLKNGEFSTLDVAEDFGARILVESAIGQITMDPDLVPKSLHNRPQTGEIIYDKDTGEIREADLPPALEEPKGFEVVDDLPEEVNPTIVEDMNDPLGRVRDWLNTDQEITKLINRVARLKGKGPVNAKAKEDFLLKFDTLDAAKDNLKMILEKHSN